jgi:hypothetical protein
MKIEDFQNVKFYQYVDDSGFVVETPDSTVPIFNPNTAAIRWHDFNSSIDFVKPELTCEFTSSNFVPITLPYLASPIPQQTPQSPYFGMLVQTSVDAGTTVVRWLGDDAAAWAAFRDSYNPFSDFLVATSVAELNQVAIACFGTYEREVVDYAPKLPVSISASDKERIELEAKDHTTHFESMTLSREHSSADLFSTVTNGLNQYGWRIWLHSSKSSSGSSSCSSRLTSAKLPRPLVAVGSIPMN